MIKLKKAVTFNEYIQPVCLPTEDVVKIKNGTIVGWGFYDGNYEVSHTPRKVRVQIQKQLDCTRTIPSFTRAFDETTMFCSGKDGLAVCQVDGGSGFYVEKNGKFYVRGILSSGSAANCSKMRYLFYSDILKNLKFLDMIKNLKSTKKLSK